MTTRPRPLTKAQLEAMEKRRRIMELHKTKISWADVGKQMGLEGATCERYYRKGLDRGEYEAVPLQYGGDNVSVFVKRPETAGALVAEAALAIEDDGRFVELRAAAKAAGMSTSAIAGMVKRLKTGLGTVLAEGRRLTIKELTEELERKIAKGLHYLDDFTMGQAGAKDLSIMLNVLIEKHQLLTGKPTHTIDFTSRQELRVLMPALMAEAKRRGITVDAVAVRVPEGQA